MQSKQEKPIIGFASSMFQTSGPLCGDSNWTEDARIGNVPDSTQAIPHWNNFEADLDLMARAGAETYRISIEWSHVEPVRGQFDAEVLAQYQRLVDACIARGIKPMLTLYHFNEPSWFTELGGFEKQANIAHFTAYCRHVFNALSPTVSLWCTINEPAVQAYMGYFLGKFPPHTKLSFSKTAEVLKNFLRAHVDAYEMLKAQPNGQESQIGIVHNFLRFKPLYRFDPIAYVLTNVFNRITNDLVMEFFATGHFDYGLGGVHYRDDRAPNANDFIGLNFYANPIVGPNRKNIYGPTCRDGQVMGDMYLPLDPDGFAEAIDEVARLGKPIYITETGVADQSDVLRQQLLPLYLDVIKRKIAEGIDIPGVYFWSGWDNYEWNEGSTKSFGFFAADRTPRPSVAILTRLINEKNNPTATPYAEPEEDEVVSRTGAKL
jgi:beta-glucosidase